MYLVSDLYCGAGGMSLGFEAAGFRTWSAFDMDKESVETFNMNRDGSPAKQVKIVSPLEDRLLISPNVVLGGPPCQGFSTLGSITRKVKLDLRRSHINVFGQHVLSALPDVFVMENVPQLFNSYEWQQFYEMMEEEYTLSYGILDAYDFGVPQRRKRAVVIGALDGYIDLPEPPYIHKTVREAWIDLPDTETDPLVFHRNVSSKSLERYAAIPYGGNRFDLQRNRPDITPQCWINKPTGTIDVMGRMVWEKPSLTIRTQFQKPEKGRYLHPTEDRSITHREAARLQTFPDTYEFSGKLTSVAKQIGNAVPPMLAYHIARPIKWHLKAKYPLINTEKIL